MNDTIQQHTHQEFLAKLTELNDSGQLEYDPDQDRIVIREKWHSMDLYIDFEDDQTSLSVYGVNGSDDDTAIRALRELTGYALECEETSYDEEMGVLHFFIDSQ